MTKTQRNRTVIIITIVVIIIIAFSFLRSKVYEMDFFKSFDIVLTNIISELWKFISNPTIFLGMSILFLVWKFRSNIEAMFPNLKELKAGGLSMTFNPLAFENVNQKISEKTDVMPAGAKTFAEEKFFEEILDLSDQNICRLFLDIDDNKLTMQQLGKKFRESGIYKDELKTANEDYRNYFYRGVFNTLWNYVITQIFTIKLSDKNRIAEFKLRNGFREKIINKIKDLDNTSPNNNGSVAIGNS